MFLYDRIVRFSRNLFFLYQVFPNPAVFNLLMREAEVQHGGAAGKPLCELEARIAGETVCKLLHFFSRCEKD